MWAAIYSWWQSDWVRIGWMVRWHSNEQHLVLMFRTRLADLKVEAGERGGPRGAI